MHEKKRPCPTFTFDILKYIVNCLKVRVSMAMQEIELGDSQSKID